MDDKKGKLGNGRSRYPTKELGESGVDFQPRSKRDPQPHQRSKCFHMTTPTGHIHSVILEENTLGF